MREMIRLSLRLLLFALIAALALAFTNEITKGPIRAQELAQANTARESVLPGADDYAEEKIERPDEYPDLKALHRVVQGGETIGYTFLVSATGYKGPIVMTLAVNQSGSVNALRVNSQSETAGLGSKVADEAFLSQYPGKAADPDAIADEVDAVTGATVSSRAVIAGVEQALRYARDVLLLTPQAGEVITAQNAGAYEELALQSGAEAIRPLSVFELLAFPGVRQVYEAEYQGEKAYLIETDQGIAVILADGTQAFPAEPLPGARAFFEQYLKGGDAP